MDVKVEKIEKGQVQIEGEIPAAEFESFRTKALEHIGKDMEIDGFRKGKVPPSIVAQKVPESAVLEEMAELAISSNYWKILEKEKIDAIGRPEVTITKIAKDNPLGFKIKTAVVPEVPLPDYKSIAKKNAREKKAEEISEEEIEKTIKEIQRMRAHQELHQHGAAMGEDHNHEELKDENLPPFDDDYVKGLGPFQTVAEFKEKLKENIRAEKEAREKEKNRIAIIEAIIAETSVELPDLIIHSEIDKMIYRLKHDIESSGMSYEDYLTHLKKTEEELRKEFEADAKKRALFELTLFAIGRKENIAVTDDEIKPEMDALLARHKDADPIRAKTFIENQLMNEKIFRMLEGQ